MKNLSVVLCAALLAAGCSGKSVSRVPNSTATTPLFPGEVWGPEQDAIAGRILDSSIETAKKNASDGLVRRDAHPKHHGCVKARWQTANLESQIGRNAGIFSETGASYDAWIRFSNGSPGGAKANDADADVRGVAIKLMGVKGTPQGSQDFVMMTSPKFFSKDAEDYMELHEALTAGGLSLVKYLATHPRNALIVNSARVKMDNPLATTYFSPVPSRIGDSSMRYKIVPCGKIDTKPQRANPNYLRQALVDTLGQKEACFDFYVQPNENPTANPIEDPRLAWDEKESPFLRAGRLTIMKQSGIDSPAQMAFCENVSFNPWNTQEELRPLGQINRIRKVVYDGVSAYRRGENRVTPAEPVNHQPCETTSTASLCAVR